MAKVKPYIITVKYISTYSDPPPTEEQILAELNIDALEVHIQPATIAALTQVEEEIDVDSRTIRIYDEPAVIEVPERVPSASSRKRKIEYGFDTKHLELKGPSVAILHTLQTLGPKTLAQVREITNRYDAAMQVSMSRMKSQGRVKVVGSDGGKALYAFVK
jgi:hypothetical protein